MKMPSRANRGRSLRQNTVKSHLCLLFVAAPVTILSGDCLCNDTAWTSLTGYFPLPILAKSIMVTNWPKSDHSTHILGLPNFLADQSRSRNSDRIAIIALWKIYIEKISPSLCFGSILRWEWDESRNKSRPIDSDQVVIAPNSFQVIFMQRKCLFHLWA
jgi:hypothetical protein